MATLDDLTTKQAELQAQLAQLEADKKQAAEQERAEQLGLITVYENEAAGYRNQAEKANSETDKKQLYQFAADADEQAYQLRRELGLLPETEPANETERRKQAKLRTLRKINALFIKAALGLVAYLFADFTSARLEMGFISFALKSLAQVFWFVSMAFGGCWLASVTLFGFVSYYGSNELSTDFRSLSPGVRLALLAGLLAAFLHFLMGIIPNAN